VHGGVPFSARPVLAGILAGVSSGLVAFAVVQSSWDRNEDVSMFKSLLQRAVMNSRRLAAAVLGVLSAPTAHASFLSGETLAKAADVMALVVIVVVPIVLIVLF
jgi:hypothetical protein